MKRKKITICKTCPNPVCGPRKRYCKTCLESVEILRAAGQRERTKRRYWEHAEDIKREYQEQAELVQSLDHKQLLKVVGAKNIKLAKKPLIARLRPWVRIPDKATIERVREHIEKKYKIPKKGSKAV